MSEFWTMTQIGALFGVSAHVVGRKLLEFGFRTQKKRPSAAAFQAGLVQQKYTDDYSHYLWAWDKDRTVKMLEEAGMEKRKEAQEK